MIFLNHLIFWLSISSTKPYILLRKRHIEIQPFFTNSTTNLLLFPDLKNFRNISNFLENFFYFDRGKRGSAETLLFSTHYRALLFKNCARKSNVRNPAVSEICQNRASELKKTHAANEKLRNFSPYYKMNVSYPLFR